MPIEPNTAKRFKTGDKVRIIRRADANDKMYSVSCDPFIIGGIEVVTLEGYGIEATMFLERIKSNGENKSI